jgi:hypothetical protein
VREPGLEALPGEAEGLAALIGSSYLGTEEADRLLGPAAAGPLVP